MVAIPVLGEIEIGQMQAAATMINERCYSRCIADAMESSTVILLL